jgi:hypothetical protein
MGMQVNLTILTDTLKDQKHQFTQAAKCVVSRLGDCDG